MEASDAEDEPSVTGWTTTACTSSWDLAPTLVAAGRRPGLAGRGRRPRCPTSSSRDGLRWVAYALETELLMNEIEDSTQRISTLVGAAKQYSQVDRAAHQDVDVQRGL